MPLRTDYIPLLQAEMVRVLPTRSTREKNAFAALDVHEQTWRFLNWQSRLVHPHARQVNRANGFDSLPAVEANKSAVQELLARLARGDDVRTHLSQDVECGYSMHAPGQKGGPDFDLLLSEWGIHHLHLNQLSVKSGSRLKSKDLLYAILGRGVVFALAVGPHRAWASTRLIEAAVRSWPNQRLYSPLSISPGRDWSETERKRLRAAGVTSTPVADNQAWLSGVTGGISTALVSNRVFREAGKLVRFLRQATEYPEHIEYPLQNHASLNDVAWPKHPIMAIQWLSGPDRYCFGIREMTSGVAVLI